MEKTTFKISKMDCPSEESLIRLKLDEIAEVAHLEFDISNRQLTVFHRGNLSKIENSIASLNLGEQFLNTETSNRTDFGNPAQQRKLLWAVIFINFAFFLIELTTGLISRSMGLVADSLDMLADSFVYGLGLFAVGGSIARKKSIARIAGYLQILLATIGFIEVVRRFLNVEEIPDFQVMIIVSIFALGANATSLYLLQRSKSEEAHMKATMICTSNDIIINLGIIIAGVLVTMLNSNKPDLIIGTIVFVLVMQGALRILKLGK
jgi:Co/Zn/Cd efflux system component